MKLSMWMIANRLSSLDLELNIRESSLAVLKSARRVYATNCVHVYSDGKDAICSGEGDTIRIPDMDLITGFEIIQGVFDYFQDWMDQLLQMVRGRNYQGIIDLAWQVFRNPLILMDGNNRVLGLTRQYPEDALDEEWYYLCNYGYPSLNAILQMRADHNNIEFWQHGAKSFQFSENRLLKYIGRSYCMYCNDAVCGRITVLCKERELNPGDYQLLELIATLLEPSLGQVYYENVLNNTNVFYNLLLGNPYDQKQLCTQLSYQQWKTEDTFYLTMIEVLANDRRQMLDKNLGILMQVILYHSQDYVVMKKTPYILLLSNRNLSAENSMLTFLSNLETYNPIKISFSLPCRGAENMAFLYHQSLYALTCGKTTAPGEKFYNFFDYALTYIIESSSLPNSVRACMPTVVKRWEMQKQKGDELFLTLKTYLDNERSISRTSEALFTHRNTVLYRIKKIQEILHRDLNEPYIRDYCRLSIYVLEHYDKKSSHL